MDNYNFWWKVTDVTQTRVHILEVMWRATHNEVIGQALDKAYDMHAAMMDILHKVELESL